MWRTRRGEPAFSGCRTESALIVLNLLQLFGAAQVRMHFETSPSLLVKTDGRSAGHLTIDAPTEITATVPACATTGTVQVTIPTGTLLSAGPFTVLPPDITVCRNARP